MRSNVACRFVIVLALLVAVGCGGQEGHGRDAHVSAVVDRAACTSPEPPGLEVSVYSDGIDNAFDFQSYGDHELLQTEVVHGGTHAISFNPSGWNYFSFTRGGLRMC